MQRQTNEDTRGDTQQEEEEEEEQEEEELALLQSKPHDPK